MDMDSCRNHGEINLTSSNTPNIKKLTFGKNNAEIDMKKGKILINGQSYTVTYGKSDHTGQQKLVKIMLIVSHALKELGNSLDGRTLQTMSIKHDSITYESQGKGEQNPASSKTIKTNETIQKLFQSYLKSEGFDDEEEDEDEDEYSEHTDDTSFDTSYMKENDLDLPLNPNFNSSQNPVPPIFINQAFQPNNIQPNLGFQNNPSNNQPFNNQPFNNQPFNNQPFNNQLFNNQPFNNQTNQQFLNQQPQVNPNITNIQPNFSSNTNIQSNSQNISNPKNTQIRLNPNNPNITPNTSPSNIDPNKNKTNHN